MTDTRSLESIVADLESQVDEFTALLAAPSDSLWHKPGDDEWSAAMAIVHMSDAEVHVAARLRWLLTEDSPVFAGWGEDEHMALTHERSPEIAVAVIAALRSSNADLVRHVSAAALDRTGTRPDGNVVNALELLQGHLDHSTNHIAQARAALG